MKRFAAFAITLCLIFAALNSSHATPPEPNAPAVVAYDRLQATEMFKLGGVGIAGAISSGEIAFRQLQLEANAVAAFTALLDDETTTKAGQLYALLGLKEAKNAEFEARWPAFLNDDSLVKTQRGCIRFPVKVKDIAAGFADKK